MAELTAWATLDRAERIRPRRSSSSFAGEDPSRIRGVGSLSFFARFPAMLKGYRIRRSSPGENAADPVPRARFSDTIPGHTVLNPIPWAVGSRRRGRSRASEAMGPRQPGEGILLEQGVDDSHDPDGLAAWGPRCDGLDGRASPEEDGYGVAAGRAVVVAFDQPAGAVLEARGRLPVDREPDRLRDGERPDRGQRHGAVGPVGRR